MSESTHVGAMAPEGAAMIDDDVFVFPTSFSQQRLWFLDQFEPGSPFYNIPSAVRLRGPLDKSALERTLAEIVRRHEALRTTFTVVDGQPMQVVWPQASLKMGLIDLQHLPLGEREAEAFKLASDEARRPFDLTSGPLIRASLLRLGPEDHIALLTMHHIVSDGWSMSLVIAEIGAIYQAFVAGRPSPLPELSIQYADYACWQREWLQGDVLEQQISYWKRQLAGAEPVLELPTDRPRPAVQSANGGSISSTIPARLVAQLDDLAARAGATRFMILLAAFQVLLQRYSGQDDICVGTPVANRPRAELEQLIGLFINTQVIRSDLSGDPTFRELLTQVRGTTLDAFSSQDLPFETVVEELQPDRDMSHSPLFQVMFILQNADAGTKGGVALDEALEMEMIDVHSGTSTFDLTLSLAPVAEGLDASLEYCSDLYDASTSRRLMTHYETLLGGIAANPDEHISRLPLLDDAERELLVSTWNQTQAGPADLPLVTELFEAHAAQDPDAVAISHLGIETTYGDLSRRANQLARHLRAQALEPGRLVGVFLERSSDALVALLGILKAGGAYVPMDPTYPQDRLAYMLADAGVSMVVTQTDLVESLPETAATLVLIDSDWPIIAQQDEATPAALHAGDNLAYVIYTSGSTGEPKGVMIKHSSLANAYLAWEKAYQLGHQVSTHLQMAAISFDVFTGDMVRALCSGGKLVICPRDILLDGRQLYALIVEERVDCAEFVPVVLRNLMEYLSEAGYRLDAMSLVICGSDSWYVAEYTAFKRLCGEHTRLINSFGLTEATIDSSYYETDAIDLPSDQPLPIGRPYANMYLYVLDGHLEPLPLGIPGELYVGGHGVAAGYWNRPDLTAERFLSSPFEQGNGARLYKTGDLACVLPDGNVRYLGRADNQIKIRGFRIEPGEIEAVLSEHPEVASAVAMAREDPIGDKRLVAYVLAVDGSSPRSGDLRRWVQARLPDYMTPFAFVGLDAFPLTPNGKIDRRALPDPDWTVRDVESEFVAPRTETESMLAELYASVLGIERVGVYDNFFELGGHSLLATQLVSRIRERMATEVPLRTVFESPTVAALAEIVHVSQASGRVAQAPPIKPVSRMQELPLSFAQQRLWFLDQLEPNSSFYNMPDSVRIRGRFDTQILERVVNEIVRRHESLRTVFRTVGGRPQQVIRAQVTVPVPVEDLRELPEAERWVRAERLAAAEARTPFNLEKGPLMRVRVLKLADQDHAILVTTHHIISDDWSSRVMIREVAALYDAFSHGRPSPLPDLTIQYADFGHWQRQWLQGAVLEEQLGYWRRQLAGIPPLLELPTDRPRPPVQTFEGSYQTFVLPDDLSRGLRDLCRAEGTTIFMTMLAAFQTLLSRYCGQEDICVGTPVANRNRGEIEGLIGFFVNTLVMRGDLSGDPSFRELLGRVREASLGAAAHQDVPFEMIVDALQPERNLSHSPLFQAMLVHQNAASKQAESLADLVIEPMEAHSGTAKFDLTLFVTEDESTLDYAIEYNTDLFDAGTVMRMGQHLRRLLEEILRDLDAPVSRLAMLSDDERERLLRGFNDTGVELGSACVHQMFEAQVDRSPDLLAVTYEGQDLSYAELDRRANQLAHYLRARSIGPEVLVGVCVERSLEMPIGLLGILKAGAAYLPVDPSYPQERVAFMLQDAQVPVLLTQSHLVSRLPETEAEVLCLDSDWDQIAVLPAERIETGVSPDNLAYVIYTSGSTGRPKGAMILHRGFTNYLEWCQRAYPLTAGQGSPVHSSISFDLTVTSMFSPLVSGGRVYLVGEDLGIETLSRALELESDFSLIKITPAHLELLNQMVQPAKAAQATKAFIIGGENLLAESLGLWRRYAPETLLVNEYGPTEAVVGCCVHMVGEDDPATGSVSIGRPITNAQMYILDRHLEPVPLGVIGELYIGGAGVARGYLNRPDLTAERFVRDPFTGDAGARIYKTGDLCRYLPDGRIEFLGRMDNQVKVRGFRIELGEIESVLGSCPQVREVVVLAREDIPGRRRLVAYVVPADAQVTQAALRAFLSEQLPDYMVPASFVLLDVLPLTPNGKIDRDALPEPSEVGGDGAQDYVAPRTAEESALAQIWCEMLGLEQVGVHDNFFDLGGDSILSIQVVARAAQAGLRLTPRQVFEHQTVSDLAAVAGKGKPVHATQGLVLGPVPLTPIQRWFFEQELPEPGHWNQAVLLETEHELDLALLTQAARHLLEHHDALRLRFLQGAKGWEQREADATECEALVDWCDLAELSATDQAHQIEVRCAATQAGLDLQGGPLLRMSLFGMGPGKGQRLLVTVHHLAMDGYSWGVLLDDLQTAYGQLSQGVPVSLPPKTTSFQYWAERLEEHARSPELAAELPFWRRGADEVVAAIPVDDPSGRNTEASATSISVALSPDQTQALLSEVPAVYHTEINDILLTALALALGRWTGSWQQVVDLEGHGREPIFEDVDLSRTVGWFTAIYPARFDLRATHGDLRESIIAVKEQLRAVPQKGIGYGLLRYLTQDQGQSQFVDSQISFNYLGQMDRALSGTALRPAAESRGPDRSPLGIRPYLIEADGAVMGGQLHMSWTYSENVHRRETIQGLADGFIDSLSALIEHCQSPDAGGFTASDVQEFGWDEQDLDAVLSELEDLS